MLSWEQVEKRLSKIRKGYETIDRMTDKMVNENPFTTDCYGVPAPWLFDLVEQHFITLCLALNPATSKEELQDFMEYYIWEMEFGGCIENEGGKEYHLDKTSEFVEYIQHEMGKCSS